nr:hypothetical protein BaRGS_003324 [Batillaria attramentaria]
MEAKFRHQRSSRTNCTVDQDIAIVIDDSESTKRAVDGAITYAPGVVEFVTELINGIKLNPSRAALVRVSNTAEVLQGFTTDPMQLTQALQTFTPEWAEQKNNMGVQVVRDLYQTSGRPGVVKYAIFVVDGISMSPEMVMMQSELSWADNITTIAVGFSGSQGGGELLVLAGNEGRVFTADTDAMLADMANMVLNETLDVICEECKNYGDVVVIADDSDSTKRINAEGTAIVYSPSLRELLVSLVDFLNLGNSRLGITLFSSSTRIIANITDDANVLLDAIDNIEPEFRGTRPDLAFQSARAQLAADLRPGATRFIVYLVDGQSDDLTALQTQAALAAQEGIVVVAIGFSEAAPPSEVDDAATSSGTAIMVSSDSDLPGLLSNITAITCQDTRNSHLGSGRESFW